MYLRSINITFEVVFSVFLHKIFRLGSANQRRKLFSSILAKGSELRTKRYCKFNLRTLKIVNFGRPENLYLGNQRHKSFHTIWSMDQNVVFQDLKQQTVQHFAIVNTQTKSNSKCTQYEKRQALRKLTLF
jgi:hypothetical protein